MDTDIFFANIFKSKGESDSVHSFLKSTPLFEGFSFRELNALKKILHLRKYSKDEIIFKEGEPGTGLYIIKSGSIRISKTLNDEDNLDQEETISSLGRHDFLGELALVEKESYARTATAYAYGETELLGLFKPDLFEIIERNPRLGVKLISRISEVIAARLRSTNASLMEKQKEIVRLKISGINGASISTPI